MQNLVAAWVAPKCKISQGLPWGVKALQPACFISGTSIGRNSVSRGTLLQILPGASTPISKFTPSPSPISVWPRPTLQNHLTVTPPPHGCTPIGIFPTLPPPLRPPGLAKTVIYPVQEVRHVRPRVPQCGKWKVWYEIQHLQCWSHQHKMTGVIRDTHLVFSVPARTQSSHIAPWRGDTPGSPPILSVGFPDLPPMCSGRGVAWYSYSSWSQSMHPQSTSGE